jgi:hypothetical protein
MAPGVVWQLAVATHQAVRAQTSPPLLSPLLTASRLTAARLATRSEPLSLSPAARIAARPAADRRRAGVPRAEEYEAAGLGADQAALPQPRPGRRRPQQDRRRQEKVPDGVAPAAQLHRRQNAPVRRAESGGQCDARRPRGARRRPARAGAAGAARARRARHRGQARGQGRGRGDGHGRRGHGRGRRARTDSFRRGQRGRGGRGEG